MTTVGANVSERLSAFPVRDPRTGTIESFIEPPNAPATDALATRMREAQPRWADMGVDARAVAMRAWRDALSAHKNALITALERDTGRRAISVMEFELVLSAIERWAAQAPALLASAERPSALPFVRIRATTSPYALVGVISPWNFPLLLATLDTIPALLAGSAVIVKPSEVTPRFIEVVNAAIADVPVLRDVFVMIPGAGATGRALVNVVDMVCFTGSVPTGRMVAEQAAARFIPAALELGGKDPAVVLATADLAHVAPAVVWGSVVNAGQSCLSIERVYVHRSRYDELVSRVVAIAQQVGLSWPDESAGPIGPLIAERQASVIEMQLADARERGAVVHCGGTIERHGGGYWIRPTVVTNVDHRMRLMTEETFGPIIPIMPFDSVDEAVHLANDSVYGLSAAVFAGTNEEAIAVAQQLDAGAISINDAALTAVMHEGEKNAFKLSGLGGSRMGAASIRRFLRQKALLIRQGIGRDPWWFPDRTATP